MTDLAVVEKVASHFVKNGFPARSVKLFEYLSDGVKVMLLANVQLTFGEVPIFGGRWPEASKRGRKFVRRWNWLLVTSKLIHWGDGSDKRQLHPQMVLRVDYDTRLSVQGRGLASLKRLTLQLVDGGVCYLPVKGGGAVTSTGEAITKLRAILKSNEIAEGGASVSPSSPT